MMGISMETLALAKEFCRQYIAEFGGVKEFHEYTDISYFPATGESEVLYVDTTTGKLYRWSGSIYVEISGETLRAFEDASNNGKVLGIVNAKFAAVDPTRDPLAGMDIAGNNGKVIGVVDGAFTPVDPTRDPLAGMDIAGNNGKVIGVVDGAFAAVGVDTLIADGDAVQY